MAPSRKQKERIKERIRLSNEAEKQGLPPDPWVVNYRKKNNETKAIWKAKQPKKDPKERKANKNLFKIGHVPKHKLSDEEREVAKERYKASTREWHKKNREKVNAKARERRRTDPCFKIKANLRKRLSSLLRIHSTKKSEQTMKLLGCDIKFFMQYLEAKFQKGMSFENYGEWHIDHIIPCDLFDFTKIEDQHKCFHYSNLQPLWAIDNRKKSNKVA